MPTPYPKLYFLSSTMIKLAHLSFCKLFSLKLQSIRQNYDLSSAFQESGGEALHLPLDFGLNSVHVYNFLIKTYCLQHTYADCNFLFRLLTTTYSVLLHIFVVSDRLFLVRLIQLYCKPRKSTVDFYYLVNINGNFIQKKENEIFV